MLQRDMVMAWISRKRSIAAMTCLCGTHLRKILSVNAVSRKIRSNEDALLRATYGHIGSAVGESGQELMMTPSLNDLPWASWQVMASTTLIGKFST